MATAVSCAGLVALVIGRIVGAAGFSGNDKDRSTLANICFGVFVLGLLVAVVAGTAAWWVGRHAGRRDGVTTGRVVGGYLVVAVVVAAVLNAR